MATPLYLVDAFTSERFRGNPAGVCILESQQTAEWMQAVAAEMNQAETAFVLRQGDAYLLRWFTPSTEIDLCGHATLAAAHVLWQERLAEPSLLRFLSNTGELTAKPFGGKVELDFPSEPCHEVQTPAELPEAIGKPIRWTGQNRWLYVCELQNEDDVLSASPDLQLLIEVPDRQLVITASSSESDRDFVSRFFGPGIGIPEDPVTGSSHCALGPYWAQKLGSDSLVGYQASKRGGYVEVTVRGDRVKLRGNAVTTLKGQLL